jgi:hypothetical protein
MLNCTYALGVVPLDTSETDNVILILSGISVAFGILTFVALAPQLIKPEQRSQKIQAPRMFVASSLFGGILLSSFSFMTALSESRSSQRFFMVCWVCSAIFSHSWTIALFLHIRWMLSIPRREGNIETLMKTIELELRSRKLIATFLTWGVFFIFLVIGLSLANSEALFRPMFNLLFVVYVVLDILQLILIILVAAAVRSLESVPFLATRLLVCSVAAVAACVWVLFALFGALSSVSDRKGAFHLISGTLNDNDCFWHWYNEVFFLVLSFICSSCWCPTEGHFVSNLRQVLLLPVLVGVQLNLIVFANFSPRLFCSSIAWGGRGCARKIQYCSDCAERTGIAAEKNCVCFSGSTIGRVSEINQNSASQLPESHPSLLNFSVRVDAQQGFSAVGPRSQTINRREDGFATNEGAAQAPLTIPPEFIEIESRAIAAGGFAQIHAGFLAGKRVAVKKVKWKSFHVDSGG